MTEPELIDAYIAASELFVQTMMFYLTIVTGYQVVAHFAGATLLRGQLAFVNTLFIAFSIFAMWGSVGYVHLAPHFWLQTETYRSFLDEELVSPDIVIGVIEAFGILASLNYMRDIRNRARERPAEDV